MMSEPHLDELLQASVRRVNNMTAEEKAEMLRKQAESWVRGQTGWPTPKFKFVGSVKVYDSYEHYCND
jgi:hypothetical protein